MEGTPKNVKEVLPGPSVRCMDVKTVAKAFCTSRSVILQWVADGNFPRPFRIGRKLLWRETTIRKTQDDRGAA